MINDSDLVSTLELLADVVLRADKGSTTSLICTELKNHSCDVLGAKVVFLDEYNYGEVRIASSYSKSNHEIFFNEPLELPATNYTKFAILYVGFNSFINRAWDLIGEELKNKGLDINKYLDTAQLRELHTFKAIALICRSKMRSAEINDEYFVNSEYFEKKYMDTFAVLKADYDLNGDGVISEDEKKISFGNETRIIR